VGAGLVRDDVDPDVIPSEERGNERGAVADEADGQRPPGRLRGVRPGHGVVGAGRQLVQVAVVNASWRPPA
jgi:hypothetical protein